MHFPKARGWTHRHTPGVMNKMEARYAAHLDIRHRAGEIVWFKFEAITFKLAKDLRYTPDFVVMRPDGLIECHETKGFFAEHNKVKTKAAAEMFPFVFIIVRAKPQKEGGGWEFETVGASKEA